MNEPNGLPWPGVSLPEDQILRELQDNHKKMILEIETLKRERNLYIDKYLEMVDQVEMWRNLAQSFCQDQSSLVAVAEGDAPASSETQPSPDADSRLR